MHTIVSHLECAKVCDGEYDCVHGSDENMSLCSYFYCDEDITKRIPSRKVCDGVFDCNDVPFIPEVDNDNSTVGNTSTANTTGSTETSYTYIEPTSSDENEGTDFFDF